MNAQRSTLKVQRSRGTAEEQIVAALRETDGGEVSSRAICERLGISRAAVWKHVETLRAEGYVIEACSRRGYRLAAAPDTPCAAEVVSLLTARRLGRDCRYVPETDSTNRAATALALAGEAEGVVVAAGTQSRGRGRMARAWFSPKDVNLYASILLRPSVEPIRAASLPLVVGLAVAEGLTDAVPGLEPRIKWPNDVLVDGKKICGILCEMQAENDGVRHIVAGFGVNVNLARDDLPEELLERATSLRIEAGRAFSRAAVLAAVLNRFEPLYDRWRAEGFGPLVPAMAERDALRGRTIALTQGDRRIEGRAEGVQPDGALLLRTNEGLVPIYSGEAHIGV